ncbi:MAG: sialate O-acetylesterase, partial [Lachnospiraceae bacterium]|nr:sialate O-acetylesterase [Lachnospiraceae bacterium]
MKKLRLPRLISSGMVLQQKKRVRIWGFDEPGRKVVISFLGKEYEAPCDGAGYFEAFLEGLEPGGPYVMNFRD